MTKQFPNLLKNKYPYSSLNIYFLFFMFQILFLFLGVGENVYHFIFMFPPPQGKQLFYSNWRLYSKKPHLMDQATKPAQKAAAALVSLQIMLQFFNKTTIFFIFNLLSVNFNIFHKFNCKKNLKLFPSKSLPYKPADKHNQKHIQKVKYCFCPEFEELMFIASRGNRYSLPWPLQPQYSEQICKSRLNIFITFFLGLT